MSYTSRVTSVKPPEVEIRHADLNGKPGRLVRRLTGQEAHYFLASLDLDHCRAVIDGFGLSQPLKAEDFEECNRAYVAACWAIERMRRASLDRDSYMRYEQDAMATPEAVERIKAERKAWLRLHSIGNRTHARLEDQKRTCLMRGTTYAALYALPNDDGTDYVITTSGGWIVRTFTDYQEAESTYLAGIDPNDEHTINVSEIAELGLWQG